MARLAFGGFVLDPVSGELRKGDDCLRIQDQPLRLLLCLLERPGQLVSREDLRRRMWEGDVHVDFEDGLNAAAWRLRQILGDSAENPVFIETVPRKGYRFVGKVLPVVGNPPPASGSFPLPIQRPDTGPIPPGLRATSRAFRRVRRLGWVIGVGLLVALAGVWRLTRPRDLTFVLTSVVNETGDPAVDYFASALCRQVGQDLAGKSGVRVVFRPGPPPAPRSDPVDRQPGPGVRWSLQRDASGYRIPVQVVDREGRSLGQAVFHASPEDLHTVHRKIADFLVERATPTVPAATLAGPVILDPRFSGSGAEDHGRPWGPGDSTGGQNHG